MAKQHEFRADELRESAHRVAAAVADFITDILLSSQAQGDPTSADVDQVRKKGFTRSEAAAYLGIGKSTLDNYRKEGKIAEDFDLGRGKKPQPMFYKGTLDRFMQHHARKKRGV